MTTPDLATDVLEVRLERVHLEAQSALAASDRVLGQSERLVEQLRRLREQQTLALEAARRSADEAMLPRDASWAGNFVELMH